MSAGNVHDAAAALFDVVVIATSTAPELAPVSNGFSPGMLPVCNRVMLWYAIKPWLSLGVRHVYICAPSNNVSTIELELDGLKDFDGATFDIVPVMPSEQDTGASDGFDEELTSADAVRAYSKFKSSLPPTDRRATKKDVMVASCDTTFAGVDMWAFIRNFYDGWYSASAVYYEPCQGLDESNAERDCLGVETPCPTSSSTAMHLRAHFIAPAGALGESQELAAGAVARRPNLTFTRAFVDAHVYLLRQWVVDFLDFHTDVYSIQDDLLPHLASRQLPQLSRESLKLPTQKIASQQPIPVPEMLRDASYYNNNYASSLACLNAMQHVNPPGWDELRTCVTVFRSAPSARITRINSVKAYRSFTAEIVNGMASKQTTDVSAFLEMVAPFLEFESARTVATAQADGVAISAVPRYCGLLSCPAPSAKVACTIVGKGVEIGDAVVLRHCVLLPGSRVAANTTLTNVVLCNNAEANQTLSGCVLDDDGGTHQIS